MKLTSSGLTHVGMKRSHNEDCLRIYRDENLFIVADGMGGHASGEVASEMSTETLAAFYRVTSVDEALTWPYKYDYTQSYSENRIRIGIQLSNQRIYQAAVYDTKLKGMGTTMVAASFYEDQCSIGHVGDSRVYLFRAGQITQLTEDHSLLNDYIKMRPGGMTEEEIEAFPHKNVIVRALGMKEHVAVDVLTHTIQEDDMILLCSDGLSGMLTDQAMNDIVNAHIEESNGVGGIDLNALCAEMITEGNRNGGNDNITVLIVRCDRMTTQEKERISNQLTPQWIQKQINPISISIKNAEIDHEVANHLTEEVTQDFKSVSFAPTDNQATINMVNPASSIPSASNEQSHTATKKTSEKPTSTTSQVNESSQDTEAKKEAKTVKSDVESSHKKLPKLPALGALEEPSDADEGVTLNLKPPTFSNPEVDLVMDSTFDSVLDSSIESTVDLSLDEEIALGTDQSNEEADNGLTRDESEMKTLRVMPANLEDLDLMSEDAKED